MCCQLVTLVLTKQHSSIGKKSRQLRLDMEKIHIEIVNVRKMVICPFVNIIILHSLGKNPWHDT